jgi:hypothetical protein
LSIGAWLTWPIHLKIGENGSSGRIGDDTEEDCEKIEIRVLFAAIGTLGEKHYGSTLLGWLTLKAQPKILRCINRF